MQRPSGGARTALATDSASGGVTRLRGGRRRGRPVAVVGGRHVELSNRPGPGAGRDVAGEVLATLLLRATGPTHVGPRPR